MYTTVWELEVQSIRRSPHLSYPGPLQLPLGVGLLVEQGEGLPAGGRWRTQAGAVTHREAQRDKHSWSWVAVEERRSQPVVLLPGVLVDIADLKGSHELPLVVQDTDLIPLRGTETMLWVYVNWTQRKSNAYLEKGTLKAVFINC